MIKMLDSSDKLLTPLLVRLAHQTKDNINAAGWAGTGIHLLDGMWLYLCQFARPNPNRSMKNIDQNNNKE